MKVRLTERMQLAYLSGSYCLYTKTTYYSLTYYLEIKGCLTLLICIVVYLYKGFVKYVFITIKLTSVQNEDKSTLSPVASLV